jgi:hypothetical protein
MESQDVSKTRHVGARTPLTVLHSEPGIIRVFEQIWGTDDLIASFDGMNVSLPINPKTGRSDIEKTTPWPHIDQDPRTCDHLELYQGIANLSPNGPDDGGLVVLAGSHKLHQQFYEENLDGEWPGNEFGGIRSGEESMSVRAV